jgi:hypothetical protein
MKSRMRFDGILFLFIFDKFGYLYLRFKNCVVVDSENSQCSRLNVICFASWLLNIIYYLSNNRWRTLLVIQVWSPRVVSSIFIICTCSCLDIIMLSLWAFFLLSAQDFARRRNQSGVGFVSKHIWHSGLSSFDGVFNIFFELFFVVFGWISQIYFLAFNPLKWK